MSSSLVSAALLRAQRSSLRPPRPVRRVARYVLQRRVDDRAAVDGWTAPLVGEGPLAAPPTALHAAAPLPPPLPRRTAADRRLRCVLVSHGMDVGGSEEVVAFLARRLPEHGIDTAVLYTRPAEPGPPPRLAAALAAEGIEIAAVTEAGADAALSELRPDVISAHGQPEWWIDLAHRRGIPYMETLHGMHSYFGADWGREADRSRRVTRFVAVSELVRRQYLAGNGAIAPERVVTIPNSVDSARMPRLDRGACRRWLGLPDDAFLFVSLARYSLQKNTYALVQAFADVAAVHPRAHLLVAGRPEPGGYAHQVRRQRDALSVRDRIHLRDHAPWPGAPLAASDAFVLDSYFEGWSLASMEALYSGVPVVLSDVGGAREQVGGDGERGYLVDNPIGDPLAVDWETIGASLYERQPNHDQLVAAMCRMVEDRSIWAARRDDLEAESAIRFHPDHALGGHARAIREAAA
jgi:glycosyltransferase involved in cell wall biosynthesis